MTTKFTESVNDPEFQKLYAVEGLLGDAAETIWQLLVARRMKQADLAKALGKSPAFVSQLLNGKSNMTVRTLAEVAHALGATIKIAAVDAEPSKEAPGDCAQAHVFQLAVPNMHVGRADLFQFEKPKNGEAAAEAASVQRSEYVA